MKREFRHLNTKSHGKPKISTLKFYTITKLNVSPTVFHERKYKK